MRLRFTRSFVWFFALALLGASGAAPSGARAQGPRQDGEPPLPAGPASIAPAHFVERAPSIDGVLDEPFWSEIEPITGFIQRDPVDGARATERTEVQIAFDGGALYFALRMFDSDPDAIRRSILHREGRIDQDDRVIIALDTYHDRRNAYIFELNAFGTQGDALIADESNTLDDWNWEGVYRSEGRVTADGWVLEVAIPFTTIRFSDAEAPEMGVAFYRAIRRKNEDVFWPHIPQRFRSGIFQVSQYATLTGLQELRRGRHIELKPYGIAGAQSVAGEETDGLNAVGVDLKYSITSNLTADLTWNTDFAQVESDNVQINLTRFNLFFPEKREFFLERAGLFSFGNPREAETFFSRRVGISNDILGGGRVTGQVGPVSVGVLSLQTEDAGLGDDLVRGANNSVVRMRADVLPRTTVGGIITSIQNADGHNRVVGADAQIRFWGSSTFEGWASRVSDSETGASSAGSMSLNLRPERWFSLAANYTDIAAGFDPALGFVQRRDIVRYGGTAAYTPRFESSDWARSLVAALVGTYIEGQDGVKQSESLLSHNMLTLQTGDWISVNARRQVERLLDPARIQGRELSAGDYTFASVDGSFRTNESRTISGNANLQVGEFWSGTRTRYGAGLTWKTGPFLTLTGSASRNDIDLPVTDGKFSTTIVSMNVLGALSRKLFANALVQYDDVSKTMQANIRVDWIHTPGATSSSCSTRATRSATYSTHGTHCGSGARAW